MRKLLSIALALMLVLSMAPLAYAEANDPIQVDVFFYNYSDTYIGNVRAVMEEQLQSMTDKFSYNFYDAGENQSTQTQQVETALTRGTDLLIVNIVTTGSDEAAQNIVDLAKEKDVPVIFFNREVSDAVVRGYEKCAFVGTDADEAGYMQGQMIADFLMEEGNFEKYDVDGDKQIAYVMFRGELGNAEARGRTKYSVLNANELLKDTGYTLVPSKANQTDETQEEDGVSWYYLYGNWSATTAKNLMDTALTTYALDNGDIELIIANNDDQALGAIESMNEKNYNTGEEGSGYVPVFGVDATVVAQDAIKGDKMTGTVKQDAEGMATCILHLAQNTQAGAELMAETTDYNVDEGVAKIRIPYGAYTGEEEAK